MGGARTQQRWRSGQVQRVVGARSDYQRSAKPATVPQAIPTGKATYHVVRIATKRQCPANGAKYRAATKGESRPFSFSSPRISTMPSFPRLLDSRVASAFGGRAPGLES